MSIDLMSQGDWVPDACTLPTVEQPLRRAEFDTLFAEDVITVTRESAQRVRLELRATPEAAACAAGLAMKETGCCSFFTFELAMTDGTAALTISAPETQVDVVAALAARAEARIEAAS